MRILNTSCPKPGISNFSKKPCSFYWGVVHLGAQGAFYRGVGIISKTFQGQS